MTVQQVDSEMAMVSAPRRRARAAPKRGRGSRATRTSKGVAACPGHREKIPGYPGGGAGALPRSLVCPPKKPTLVERLADILCGTVRLAAGRHSGQSGGTTPVLPGPS